MQRRLDMQPITLLRPQALAERSTEKLSACLRGELAAVETYELALRHVNHEAARETLESILRSHQRRAELIHDKMARAGLRVPASSGAWGALAKAVQVGADLLSLSTAVAALEAGEDRGLRVYTSDLDECDHDTRYFIATTLLPEQRRTHELCRSLKRDLRQPKAGSVARFIH
jgi:demethoxyubiquinone hydroxylase (CLK1/Coq7/Cat5 family)